MKNIKLLCPLVLILFFASCSSTKKASGQALFGTTWELEYLSGPRIAFEGLFPDRKPGLKFDRTTKRVEGSTGCNGYTADYVRSGNSISFGEPGPTTMMYCGEGETIFLNTIKKIDRYAIDADGKLNLMLDDSTLMRFKARD